MRRNFSFNISIALTTLLTVFLDRKVIFFTFDLVKLKAKIKKRSRGYFFKYLIAAWAS